MGRFVRMDHPCARRASTATGRLVITILLAIAFDHGHGVGAAGHAYTVTVVNRSLTGAPLIDAKQTPAEYPNVFLNTFGKPRRSSVCECERSVDQTLASTLHIVNGETISSKLTDKNGRVARLTAAKTPVKEFIEELFLATWCRKPTVEELQVAQEFVSKQADLQAGLADLLWVLISSKNFLYVN